MRISRSINNNMLDKNNHNNNDIGLNGSHNIGSAVKYHNFYPPEVKYETMNEFREECREISHA